MKFKRHLRERLKGGLPRPVSMGFSVAEWSAAFEALSDDSEDDKNLYKFGIFLFERLEKIRQMLSTMEKRSEWIESTEVVQQIAQSLNRSFERLLAKQKSTLTDRAHVAVEELLMGRSIQGYFGGDYSMQEAVESQVDAARFPLRSVLQRKGFGTKNPEEPTWPQRDSLQVAIEVAHLYDTFEKMWEAALWTDAWFEAPSELEYQLLQLDPLMANVAIDLARRNLKYERDTRALQETRLHPSALSQLIVRVREDYALDVVELREFKEPVRQGILSIAYARIGTMDQEFAELLRHRHPEIDVPIHKALDLWMQLGCIAMQCLLYTRNHEQNTGAFEESLGPVWDRNLLAQVLSKAARVPDEKCLAMLDYFTFTGSRLREETLWEQPLLRQPNGLSLVWSPLLNTHSSRQLARWASKEEKLLNVHARRGNLFQRYVFEALNFASKSSPLEEKPLVLGPGLKLTDPKAGDIDVLLILGRTAFILECRIVMHPATPYENWTVAAELTGKLEQVVKQRDHMLRDGAEIGRMLRKKLGEAALPEIKEYVAVVVSNSYFFEGQRDTEPYFIHIDTLFNTILSAGPTFNDVDASGLEKEYHVDFFSEGVAAGESLAKAIAEPPKAAYYRELLRPSAGPVPGVDQTEPVGSVATWAVQRPPLGRIRQLLANCSFGHQVVERSPSAMDGR